MQYHKSLHNRRETENHYTSEKIQNHYTSEEMNQEIEEVSPETIECLLKKSKKIQKDLLSQYDERHKSCEMLEAAKSTVRGLFDKFKPIVDDLKSKVDVASRTYEGIDEELETFVMFENEVTPTLNSQEVQVFASDMDQEIEDISDMNQENELISEDEMTIKLLVTETKKELRREIGNMNQLKERVEAANQKIFGLFRQYISLVDEIRVAKDTNQGTEEILPLEPRIQNVLAYLKTIEDDLKIPRSHVSRFTQKMQGILQQATIECLLKKSEKMQEDLLSQYDERHKSCEMLEAAKSTVRGLFDKFKPIVDDLKSKVDVASRTYEGIDKQLEKLMMFENEVTSTLNSQEDYGSHSVVQVFALDMDQEMEDMNQENVPISQEEMTIKSLVRTSIKTKKELRGEIDNMKQLKELVEAANQKIFKLFPQYKSLVDEIRVAKATTQGIKEILPRIENVFAYLKNIEDDLKIPRCHVSHQGTVSQFTQVMEAIFHQEEHRSEDVDEQNRRPIVVPISSRLRPRATNKSSHLISFGQAISRGNYDEVTEFLKNGVPVTAMISGKESAFRRACVCGNEKIVQAMLERMNHHETITKLLTWGCLQMVIANGNLKITEALVNKKPTYCDNLMVLSGCQMLPVVYAAIMSKKDIVSFLYKKTSNEALLYSDGHQATQLFCHTITNGMLDIALEIFKRYPRRLAVTKHPEFDSSPMVCLAECDALVLIPNNLGIWKKFLYSCVEFTPPDDPEHQLPTIDDDISTDGQIWKKKIGKVLQWLPKSFGIGDLSELKLKNWQARALTKAVMNELSDMDTTERENGGLGDAIFLAVKCGNREYLIDMVKTNPECLYCTNNMVRSNLFMLAVMFRKPEIFSLYYGLDERRDYMTLYPDEKGESSLLWVVAAPKIILRGSSPSPVVAPLELQRELQWFQEMEVVLPNLERSKLDNLVESPWDKFQENHAPLRKKAEVWMKGTATSCSVVAILIATIAFQAIFTVPGGVKSESGHPLNLTEASFTVFVIADFCAFFLACTATFIFLGILTARHSIDDFLMALPSKMIAGQVSLIISVVAMLVAFCTALFTSVHPERWLMALVVILVCLPIAVFLWLQVPLLWIMSRSTFGRGLFDRNPKRWV